MFTRDGTTTGGELYYHNNSDEQPYDSTDLSRRTYDVSYKIVDNIGFVQTIKIFAEIRSKEIVAIGWDTPNLTYKDADKELLKDWDFPIALR